MPLYFIAIVAPPEINAQVSEYKGYMQERFGCKVALRSPAHITLVPPFNMSVDEEKTLLQALDFFWKQRSSFEIAMQDFAAFKPRVIYVDVTLTEELANVKRDLESFLFECGYPIKKETRSFHPHMTIANRDLERKDFPLAWQHFASLRYEARFVVDRLALLRSEKGGWKILEPSPAFE